MKYYLFFFLLAFLGSVIGIDYHLDQTITLNGINSIIKVTALKDDTIAVQSLSSQNSIVTLLQGTTFDNKIQEIQSAVDQSQIKPTANGVYINDGDSLTQKNSSRLNLTFASQKSSEQLFSLGSNMVLTPIYALAGKFDSEIISLKVLNLVTKKATTLTYGTYDDWRAYAGTILQYVGNGDIVFSKGKYLFVLDDLLLTSIQTISDGSITEFIDHISTFYEAASEQTTLIFSRNRNIYDTLMYSVWIKDKVLLLPNDYIEVSSFYVEKSLQGSLVATSLNTAVSIIGYKAYYWNIQSVLRRSFNPSDSLKDSFPVTVGFNETFFITRDNEGFYSYYQIGVDYSITYRKSLFVRNNSHLNARTTTDDRYLFISTLQNSTYNIHKIDMQTFVVVNSSLKTSQSNQSYIDFYLFDANLDRVAMVSYLNSTYYLNLLSISDETLIDKLQIDFPFSVQEIHLIGDTDWGITFAVVAQVENDLMMDTYTIQNDKIIANSSFIGKPSFLVSPCSKYVVVSIVEASTIKILNYTDLTLVRQIIFTEFANFKVQTERNIMIISDTYGTKNIVYDLDISWQEDKGSFYISSNSAFIDYNFAIFSQRGLYYQVPKNYSSFLIATVIYNIANPALTSVVQLQSSTKIRDSAVYLQSTYNGAQCNMIFYIQYKENSTVKVNPQLVRYFQCSKTMQKYTVLTNEQIFESSVSISKDKKYLISGIQFSHSLYFLVEIRLLSNLSNIISRQNVTTSNFIPILTIFDVSITFDNKLIIQTPFTITVLDLQSQSFSNAYGISSISIFDVEKGITAFAGPSLASPSDSTIIIRDQTYNTVIFEQSIPTPIQSVILSPLGTYVAVLTTNSTIYAWKISSQRIVFFGDFQGVVKIIFAEQYKLLIQLSSTYQIIIFTAPTSTYEIIPAKPLSSLAATSYDVQVSNSGDLMAIVSNNVINIYKNTGEIVNTFTAPISSSQKVVSVSFSPNNNLIIATDSGSIYVLLPTGCQQGSVNLNLVCKQCEFPCKYCSGSTTSCTQYSAWFFVLVIGGPLLFLITIAVIIICIKRRRSKADESDKSNLTKKNYTSQQNSERNIEKPLKYDLM